MILITERLHTTCSLSVFHMISFENKASSKQIAASHHITIQGSSSQAPLFCLVLVKEFSPCDVWQCSLRQYWIHSAYLIALYVDQSWECITWHSPVAQGWSKACTKGAVEPWVWWGCVENHYWYTHFLLVSISVFTAFLRIKILNVSYKLRNAFICLS